MILHSRDGRRREIIHLGHPVLRERAEAVAPERLGTRFLRDLARDLVRTMFEDDGVGLAAPQIAAGVRVFAYYLPADKGQEEMQPRVLVNPELTLLGERTESAWEGCLSVPGLRGLVLRHPGVRVQAVDVEGEPINIEAEGFHARVIQHEFDHLDGIVFLDRMTDMSSLMFEPEWERYTKATDLSVTG